MSFDKSILEKYKYHDKEALKYEEEVKERINHILRNIAPKVYTNFNLEWWDFMTYDYNSEEDGRLSFSLEGNYINLRCNHDSLMSDTLAYFKVDYLTMSDKDIVDDLTNELNEFNKLLAEEKSEEEAEDNERKLALSKLSKKEKELLGLD